ncbi:hypothetical protein JTE90_014316 [Oedothorax gibbosus]|uniref:Uncharacterized protein n=1 Tax=Oedothorax gibbosus TaxID=931172 RepID=A0AAV6UWL8_9ARAC|nr:hypothetical protein JTE90_014316 [Oedothorax gibbosus]
MAGGPVRAWRLGQQLALKNNLKQLLFSSTTNRKAVLSPAFHFSQHQEWNNLDGPAATRHGYEWGLKKNDPQECFLLFRRLLTHFKHR